MAKNFLKSSLQNASFNIIFQIMFRCLTFVMNAFVLRYVGQAVIGVMNVRLLLLESTILFLSREAFRRACLTNTMAHNWAQVINLLWFMVPLCSVMCLLFGWIWLYVLEPPAEHITPHYTIGVYAIAVSCVIEMCVEPLYLVSQAFLFVRFRSRRHVELPDDPHDAVWTLIRNLIFGYPLATLVAVVASLFQVSLKVVMDTINVIVRTTVFTSLVVWWPEGAVVAFSAAQLVAVVVYSACYYIYFANYLEERRSRPRPSPKQLQRPMSTEDDFPFSYMWEFLPRRLENQPLVDWKLCVLTWSFFKQGILKQILTEGERYVMTLFSVLTFYEQGVFDVVNNLGSLAARFLFRPIEESAYFYFSQLVNRDKPIDDQNPYQMVEASSVLQRLLRTVVSLGLVALCFGQAYARLVLLLYGGPALASGLAPLLLRTHSLAILLLAVNGTTECYALATMDTAHLDRYNRVMAALSVGFMLVSWLFTRLFGSVGFILANCCNMAARITHSVLFIKRRYHNTVFTPLDGLVPGRRFCVVVLSLAAITMVSEAQLYSSSKTGHLLVGVLCLAATVATWLYEERDLVRFGVDRWRRQSLKLD